MYRNLHQFSPIGRPLGKPKSRPLTRYRTPVGLSVNLTQRLQKRLYPGLHQHVACVQLVSTLCDYDTGPKHSLGPPKLTSSSSLPPSISVRNVRMLPGELIGHIFSSEDGLISEPLPQGRILLLTNQRVIAFGKKGGIRDTVIVPLEEIKVVVVNAGQRSIGTLFQGSMMVVAAVLFYVILAYWLTGRIDGPQVPIVRMDFAPFIAFLVVLSGIAALVRMYFAKPDGGVTFQGDGVKFMFPFRGEASEDEVYVLVNAAFSDRQKIAH